MYRLLIVDDDRAMLKGIELNLEDHTDYQVKSASDKKTAFELLKQNEFDLVVSDLMVPEVEDGQAIVREAKSMWYRPFVLTMTAFESWENAVSTMKAGADDFISKGFGLDELTLRIENLLKKKRQIDHLEFENRILKETIQQQYSDFKIIGQTPVMKKLTKKLSKVAADARSTCLIYGETGTGKDLVARNIHALSPRREAPFVPINCAAIPENLIESELFGHERGSFTGAHTAKQGKFEIANGGVIFLDEIGELHLPLQVRLLRVLEERSFYRIGGKVPINVDIMVLAATNKDLKRMVKEENFRQDLFYRLDVITIEVPPLRKRKQDIPLLTRFFLDKFNRDRNKNIEISEEALQLMMKYNFYGNVRELRNIIEDAFVLCEDDRITPENLSLRRTSLHQKKGDIDIGDTLIPGDHVPHTYENAIEKFEKAYFTKMLELNDWNFREAAKDAGISREWLSKKIKKLKIRQVRTIVHTCE
ncbi:MAG: sigma-54 dependent transcriptional regulator [Calditrichia bacterium]|jgi:DNA-binding NtrC family response regulator